MGIAPNLLRAIFHRHKIWSLIALTILTGIICNMPILLLQLKFKVTLIESLKVVLARKSFIISKKFGYEYRMSRVKWSNPGHFPKE